MLCYKFKICIPRQSKLVVVSGWMDDKIFVIEKAFTVFGCLEKFVWKNNNLSDESCQGMES